MANSDSLIIASGLLPSEFVDQASGNDEHAGFQPAQLSIRGGQIQAVTGQMHAEAGQWLDAVDCFVLPGFVDVHVHGVAGYDTMDATAEALDAMARFCATSGVTAFLPTTTTATREDTLAAVQAVGRHAGGVTGGARILGVHLEGPYLSPRYPGAQRADQIRPPDPVEFAALLRAAPIRMITLAPEQPGAEEIVAMARARDVVVVTGHTSASYEESEIGFGWGINQATHTFNAMRGLHHREPGALGAVLSDDAVFAQLIADNIHVHPAAMKILWRCKGADRTVLITDAIRATGLSAGEYDLGGQPVTVSGGRCCLADGTLAGSVLTMDRALANFMAATGESLARVWPAASRTPITSIGMQRQLGMIAPGFWADLVLLDRQFQVVATIVAGRVVYLRDPDRLTKSGVVDQRSAAV